MPSFWNDIIYSIKVMAPLVHVLRLVDNEKMVLLEMRVSTRRFLNPQFYYSNPRIESDREVMMGLHTCIERLSVTDEEYDAIQNQLRLYKRAADLFGINGAIKSRATRSLAEWWRMYGASPLEVQAFAIKILSLTCSSSGCERSWSIFEHIHSKKRSKLEHQILQDLVYIKYNQSLKDCFDCRDLLDPILLDDIDESNEWMTRNMGRDGEDEDANEELVFDDDNLTWGDVANFSGAGQPLKHTRQQTRVTNVGPKRRGKGKQPMLQPEELDDESEETEIEEEDEDEEVYKTNSSGSDNEIESWLNLGDDSD